MNRLLLSVLAAGTFLAGGVAIAQAPGQPAPPPPHHGEHGFFGMDTNKDGAVTRAEVTAQLEQRFAALDTDRNGVISAAEWKAARDARRDERFNKWFDAIDTDKNGQLSRDELKAAHERREDRGPQASADAPRPGGPDGERGPGGGEGHRFGKGGFRGHGFGGPGFGGPGGFGRGPQGDVTKAQFMARPLQLFDVLDSNHDGKISPAEREAAFALMHPMGPGRHGDPAQPPAAAHK